MRATEQKAWHKRFSRGRLQQALWLVAALTISQACAAQERPLPALGVVEVIVDIPPSNFVYRQADRLVYGPAAAGGSANLSVVFSPGVSFGAALGINLVANVVVLAVEAAATETAREAAGPVGAAIQNVDLRATVFEQLRQLTPAGGPRWVAREEAFPRPDLEPEEVVIDPTAARPASRPAPDLIKPLVERAKRSEHEATLFVRILPLFRGFQGKTYVQAAALLFDRKGNRLAEWNTQVMGPESPNLPRPELVQWWADGRYRQFMAQAVRASLFPLVEDVANPIQRAERQRLLRVVQTVTYDEVGRPNTAQLDHFINAPRMRSTPCALRSDNAPVVARYERSHIANHLFAAVYCVGESIQDWKQDVVPGISWMGQFETPPPLIVRATP